MGAEVVRVAFRLGVVVHEVSQNLEPRDLYDSQGAWASVVPGVKAEDVQVELNAVQAREVGVVQPHDDQSCFHD